MTDPAIQITALDPDAGMFQTLRRELGVTSFGINALTLQPKQRLRVHRHERQEEVYLVLEGELTLIVEGEPTAVPSRLPGPGRTGAAAPADQPERRAGRADRARRLTASTKAATAAPGPAGRRRARAALRRKCRCRTTCLSSSPPQGVGLFADSSPCRAYDGLGMEGSDPLREAYVPNRRVRLGSDVAAICVVGLLIGLLGSGFTWWDRSALFDLADNSLQVVKLGLGYLAGPILILIATPLVFGRGRQVALTRLFKPRLVLAALLWAAGLVILIAKVSALDGYTIKAGTYVTGGLLLVGLISTLAMWPAGLAVVKIDRKGNERAAPEPEPS